MIKNSIINDFQTIEGELNDLKLSLSLKLDEIISHSAIKTYQINGRVKERESLEHKISRPDKNYISLGQITDLVALRIIIYSEDLITDVARLIEKYFDVDYDHSTNKLHSKDSQKFGYRSLHYICKIPGDIQALESRRLDIKFEIQIRTILQHTWAEIEHEIGYKASSELPVHLRRRLSQISSLLEIADREFVDVREEFRKYEEAAQVQVQHTDQVQIDQISIRPIIDREEIYNLDKRISKLLNIPISRSYFFIDYLLKVLFVSNLGKLASILNAIPKDDSQFELFAQSYFEFSKKHLGFDVENLKSIQRGYSLLFLAHLTIINSDSLLIDRINTLTNFYHRLDYEDDFSKARFIAKEMIEYLKQQTVIVN